MILTILGVIFSLSTFAQYTLQDADVEVIDGVIESCSYAGGETSIIIPQNLDDQIVVGIADFYNGIFSEMGLTSIQLPTTMEFVGAYAFYQNEIVNVNFSNCPNLERIGIGAFNDNLITEVDLSDNQNLVLIESGAFFNQDLGTSLTSVDLSGCTSLIRIEGSAFSFNEISTLSLNSCTALEEIGNSAFSSNELNLVNLSSCTSLITIGTGAFSQNNIAGFSLPVNTQYTQFGWIDNNDNYYDGGAYVTDLAAEYWIPVIYTIQDADVIIVDGVITEFNYDYTETSITIPQVLQGQTVIGIEDNAGVGVFEENGITEIIFPSTMQFIGDRAFKGNEIASLDLSQCPSLVRIGISAFESNNMEQLVINNLEAISVIDNYAFKSNNLGDIDFSNNIGLTEIGNDAFCLNSNGYYSTIDLTNCSSLLTIGYGAFCSSQVNQIIFNGCTSLTIIRNGAFYQNSIVELDFSPLTSLEIIEPSAFAYNTLTSVSFENCTNLYQIGYWVFSENADLNSFQLPDNPDASYYYWRSSDGNTESGGDIVSDFDLAYVMPVYTLKDEDVTVVEAYITECLVDFPVAETHLIIPDVLDNQPIYGIADGAGTGVFEDKDIVLVKLSNTIKKVGDYAFKGNVITNFPMGGYTYLLQIGVEAFADNQLTTLDVNGYSLTVIDEYAFTGNQLTEVNLNGATALRVIGDYAFVSNQIHTLTMNSANHLQYIGEYAFAINTLVAFTLPTPDIAGYNFNHWMGTNSSTYAGGATASNLNIGYNANLTTVGHSVMFNITDGTNPVEGAIVSMGEYGIRTTNSSGIAFFESVIDGDHYFEVNALGFDVYGTAAAMITMVGIDITEDVVLTPSVYDVVFGLYDGLSPAGTSIINFDGVDYTVGSGHLQIEGVSPGTYAYTITSDFYSEVSSTVDVVAVDVNLDIYMERVYTVNFAVTDGTDPIENANVNFDGVDYITNASGLVSVLDLTEGLFEYNVSADGYSTYSSTVTVLDNDLNIDVVLDAVYILSFNVSDGMNPLANANVIFNGTDYVCDAAGQLVLEDILGGTYDYTVSAEDYSTINGSVTLDSDETVNIALEFVYDIEFFVSDGTLPIENASIDFNGEVLITNVAGFVTYNNVPAGIHTYIISSTGFQTTSGMITVDGDLTETVTMASVGVDQISLQSISVYPNPTVGYLNFDGIDSVVTVEVFDETGKQVGLYKENANFTIDMTDYRAGLYVIRLMSEESNEVVTKRIIKQ